jgi:predicted metal-dependent phosphoesterase TrpH
MQVKADLHVHTTYSKDSLITPKELVFFAKQRGLNAVAVTDHNSLVGAFKIAKETDFPIIPGMEVSSSDGHIVALNVSELIPRGLGAAETVDRIHHAGGIAIACHAYALFKGSLGKNAAAAKFDAVEVVNARAFPFGRCKRKAEELARQKGFSRVGGTDAHYGRQVGYGYTVIDAELDVDSVCKAIVAGRCEGFGQPVPVFLNLELEWQRVRRLVKKASST